MYIWIGCKLPEEFERKIRAKCMPVAAKLDLDTVAFTLPQHISLKISFEAAQRWEEILDTLCSLLQKEKEFVVHPKAVQQEGNILWISFRENDTLLRLHHCLDELLCRKFGIAQHLFDRAFQFHSTLFFGQPDSVALAAEVLHGYPLSEKLRIDTFLLGISESGKPGTYSVVRTIDLG